MINYQVIEGIKVYKAKMTRNGEMILEGKCPICGKIHSRFAKWGEDPYPYIVCPENKQKIYMKANI